MDNTLEIHNSYAYLRNFPSEVYKAVDYVLTYQNDIEAEKTALFQKMKFLNRFIDSEDPKTASKARQKIGFCKKQLKELQDTEFVHWLDGDQFPTGHLHIVQDVLAELYPKYKIVDHRKLPEKKYDFILCKDFPPSRYYQIEMHKIGMAAGRGVFESAVGTGKSQVLMELLLAFGVTSLIVVPSKPLLKQLHKSLVEHFGERNVQVCNTEKVSKSKARKMSKRPIRLINVQALASLNKKGETHQLVSDVDAIFIDEIHHAGSKSYTDLLPIIDHIYYRFGFTGTFMRNDAKTLDMWGFLSTKLYSYPAWKAIKEKFLTPVKVIQHTLQGIQKRNYQREYQMNYCGGEEILNRIGEILHDYVESDQQTLILVDRKEQSGAIIHEYLDKLGFENTYISGDDEDDCIDDAIVAFNEKRIKILIASKVIGEGVDIRSTDHLIMAQGGKSEIAIVQAAGRLIRLFPGKILGYLHDFRFIDTKYMEKHFEIRQEIYQRNLAPQFQAL